MDQVITTELYRARIQQLQPDANAVLVSDWSPHCFDALQFVQQNIKPGDDAVIECQDERGIEVVVDNRKGSYN